MLRWLMYVVLALWAARLARLVQPRSPRRPVKDFHPADGGAHPSGEGGSRQEGPFGPGEIVDGEFEDVPTSRRP